MMKSILVLFFLGILTMMSGAADVDDIQQDPTHHQEEDAEHVAAEDPKHHEALEGSESYYYLNRFYPAYYGYGFRYRPSYPYYYNRYGGIPYFYQG